MKKFRFYLNEELGELLTEQVLDIYREVAIADIHLNNRQLGVRWEATQNGIKIVAYGRSILFVEFGAGAEAGGSPYADKSAEFTPGSWSEEHGGTYQAWVEEGAYAYPDGSYWYAQPPAHAFDTIIDNMDYFIGIAVEKAIKRVGKA